MKAIIALFLTKTVFAAAPFATTPAVHYNRTKLGAFEVTTLADGTVELPMSKLLIGIKPADYKKTLDRHFMAEPFGTFDNAFLVNTGSKLLLVDSGAGKLFAPTLGLVASNLKAAGYKPEQVDAVLITHMHVDHVGGLVDDGKIVFPNATIYASKPEADYWLSEENMNKAPEDKKGFFKGAQTALGPYVKAGKVKWFETDEELFPGVRATITRGHTAGHVTYTLESEGKKMYLLGDTVHMAAVQFEKPTVRIQFDSDPDQAEKNRMSAFSAAAKDGALIGAPHLPYPSIGRVRAEKKGFTFVPAPQN